MSNKSNVLSKKESELYLKKLKRKKKRLEALLLSFEENKHEKE